MMDSLLPITPMISQNRRFYNERNFDRTGQRAGSHHPAGHAAGHRSTAAVPCEQKVLPRTPAVLFVGRYDGPIQPASLLNRTYRGRQLYGPILCYGWKGNSIVPLNKALQAELLDRLKDTEVRV